MTTLNGMTNHPTTYKESDYLGFQEDYCIIFDDEINIRMKSLRPDVKTLYYRPMAAQQPYYEEYQIAQIGYPILSPRGKPVFSASDNSLQVNITERRWQNYLIHILVSHVEQQNYDGLYIDLAICYLQSYQKNKWYQIENETLPIKYDNGVSYVKTGRNIHHGVGYSTPYHSTFKINDKDITPSMKIYWYGKWIWGVAIPPISLTVDIQYPTYATWSLTDNALWQSSCRELFRKFKGMLGNKSIIANVGDRCSAISVVRYCDYFLEEKHPAPWVLIEC